jgi:hypothetical protein
MILEIEQVPVTMKKRNSLAREPHHQQHWYAACCIAARPLQQQQRQLIIKGDIHPFEAKATKLPTKSGQSNTLRNVTQGS